VRRRCRRKSKHVFICEYAGKEHEVKIVYTGHGSYEIKVDGVTKKTVVVKRRLPAYMLVSYAVMAFQEWAEGEAVVTQASINTILASKEYARATWVGPTVVVSFIRFYEGDLPILDEVIETLRKHDVEWVIRVNDGERWLYADPAELRRRGFKLVNGWWVLRWDEVGA